MDRRALLTQLPGVLPRDKDDPRFTRSFPEVTPEAREFFEQYGVVVFRDVLSPAEAAMSTQSVFDLLEDGSGGQFRRDDVRSWDAFPDQGMEKFGMPTRDPVLTPQFLANRAHPKVHAAFAALLGTDELLVNHDRCSFMRPTAMRCRWGTATNLHLDMSPWSYLANCGARPESYRSLRSFFAENNGVREADGLCLQAIISFVDNEEQDGGFWAVPGFRHIFHEFFAHYACPEPQRDAPSLKFVGPLEAVSRAACRVTTRAGSMVVWDQMTPHGSVNNNSSNPRIAMFLKLFPAAQLSPALRRQRAALLARRCSRRTYRRPSAPARYLTSPPSRW